MEQLLDYISSIDCEILEIKGRLYIDINSDYDSNSIDDLLDRFDAYHERDNGTISIPIANNFNLVARHNCYNIEIDCSPKLYNEIKFMLTMFSM